MIAVDLFAGGGGASLGIEWATGHAPIMAVNHCRAAIEMHAANHPGTLHLHESVWDVHAQDFAGTHVDLLWASPDCTHFSRAKGAAPRSKEIRSLAWVIVDWARDVRPTVICMENVPEFVTWGPLLEATGQPDKTRAGETFRSFVGRLEAEGYAVEWRVLNAADYGAPTSRRRLFLVARRDGAPIGWPEPTHGPGRALPWRVAAECIDWTIPVPSIFDRKRPLAEATQRRIAEGVRRYVLTSASPFLLNKSHGGRLSPLTTPLATVTSTPKGGDRWLVAPMLARAHSHGWDGNGSDVRPLDRPGWTVTAKDGSALVAAFLARHNGGPNGHPSYGRDLRETMGTVTGRDTQAIVIAECRSTGYYGGEGHDHGRTDRAGCSDRAGADQGGCAGSHMALCLQGEKSDHHAGVANTSGDADGTGRLSDGACLAERETVFGLRPSTGLDDSAGSYSRRDRHQSPRWGQDQQSSEQPGAGDTVGEPTACGGDRATNIQSGRLDFVSSGQGFALAGTELRSDRPRVEGVADNSLSRCEDVAAFIIKFYGQGGQWSALDEPMHTLVGKARMGLVTVTLGGEEYALVDIGMRMLQPRELARAQGFPDSYILTGTKSEQVARIGNSVCPPVAEALVRAQFPSLARRAA